MANKDDPFNKQIEKQLEILSTKIIKRLESEKNQIIKKAKEKKIFYIKLGEKRDIPNIKMRLDSQPNMNYLINPILFCLANLEIITEFILSDEKKEILDKFPDKKNFIRNFYNLMIDMREKNIVVPGFGDMHKYLQTYMIETYQSQEPKYIINSFFSSLEKEINFAKVHKENKFSNLIQDNFSIILKTNKKCINCYKEEQISEDTKYIIDLFLIKSVLAAPVDIQDNFKEMLVSQEEQNNFAEKCSFCKSETLIIRSLENMKKYLILNINRGKEQNDLIKLKYSALDLKGSDNKKYKFELISALCDINTSAESNDQSELLKIKEKNRTDFKIFFKNFINDKWYRKLDSDAEMLQRDDIEEEIRDYKPNILIYKRVK